MIPIKNSDSFSCERHNMWPEFVLCFFIIGRITWYISSMNSGWTSLCAVIRSARELPWMLSKLQRCYCEWSKSVPHRWKCFHLLILSYMLGLRNFVSMKSLFISHVSGCVFGGGTRSCWTSKGAAACWKMIHISVSAKTIHLQVCVAQSLHHFSSCT